MRVSARQGKEWAGQGGEIWQNTSIVSRNGYTDGMSSKVSSSSASRSSVNLVRSSHSWTEAESAAGFVLRYLPPMRKQLVQALGTAAEADQALKILLTHLVSAGFGDHRKGRLRDYLFKAVRSAAKAHLTEQGRLESDRAKLDVIANASKEWLVMWRDCLLHRAWRALERMEHHDRQRPLYTVLWTGTTHSQAGLDELGKLVEQACGVKLDQVKLQQMKLEAKAAFAQLLADEIVETLETPDKASVKKEIQSLGIGSAFTGLTL